MKGKRPVRMKAEVKVMQLKPINVKDFQQTPEATGKRGTDSPSPPSAGTSPAHTFLVARTVRQ